MFRRCLEGLGDVERSDSMYRDSFRAICLCSLGRTALDQGDREGARASFAQALTHLRGRPRGLGGGQLVVQALAGLARATDQRPLFEESQALFQSRQGYDFSALWTCTDDVSRIELARTAAAFGQPGAMDLIAESRRVPPPGRR